MAIYGYLSTYLYLKLDKKDACFLAHCLGGQEGKGVRREVKGQEQDGGNILKTCFKPD